MKHIISATSAFAALAMSTPVLAQDAAEEEAGVQDIIVTAQRRNESAQDVPIAISAFSSEQLEAQGINNTYQLGQYIPNLFALNNTGLGSANGYYLRGLGNTESIATFDPPVGTYVDDIYLSRQNANNLSLLDVERIEVLRGPQGTLFGRNTTGGAISVIMRDPGKDFGGYLEGASGRFGKLMLRGSVDLPVSENVLVKASAFSENDDGYVKNITTGRPRLNDSDAWGARLGFKVTSGENFSWRASVARLVNNGENIVNFLCNPANPADCSGRFASTGFVSGKTLATSAFAPLVITGRKAKFGQGNRTQNTLITSNLEFGLGGSAKVNLITGFVNLRQQFALDFFDGRGSPSIAVPFPVVRGFTRGGFVITNDGLHKQFTQEVKLSGDVGDSISYVGGFYYIKERNTTDFADIFALSPAASLLLADRTLRNQTTAKAGYLQADFKASDTLKVTAGIRYTDESKTFNISDNRASCNDGTIEATCLVNANMIVNPPVVAVATPVPTKQRAKVWTPRFAVNYQPNDDMLVFISATRGFKSGGWNARGTSGAELLPFGPEKVWSYEAGIKADLLDKKLRANLTVYYQDTSDLQTPSAFVRANGTLAFITRNFADYRNKGAELELTYQPTRALNLYANMGYQSDKYVIDRNAPALDPFGVRSVAAQQALCLSALAAGNVPGGPNTTNCGAGIVAPDGSIATPVRTPKLTLALGGSYKASVGGSGWSLTPSINASYASSSETGTSNVTVRSGSATGTNGTFPANLLTGDFIAGSFSKAHWLMNASLTIKTPNEAVSLGIECTNCFNTAYVQSSLSNYSYYNRPMEWVVRGKYKF